MIQLDDSRPCFVASVESSECRSSMSSCTAVRLCNYSVCVARTAGEVAAYFGNFYFRRSVAVLGAFEL